MIENLILDEDSYNNELNNAFNELFELIDKERILKNKILSAEPEEKVKLEKQRLQLKEKIALSKKKCKFVLPVPPGGSLH